MNLDSFMATPRTPKPQQKAPPMDTPDLKTENEILKAKVEMLERIAVQEHGEMVSQDSMHADDLEIISDKLDKIIVLLARLAPNHPIVAKTPKDLYE